MPRNTSTMPICAPSKDSCVRQALAIEHETVYRSKQHGHIEDCHCLPTCSDVTYPHDLSTSKIRHQWLTLPAAVLGKSPKVSFCNNDILNGDEEDYTVVALFDLLQRGTATTPTRSTPRTTLPWFTSFSTTPSSSGKNAMSSSVLSTSSRASAAS